MKIQIINMIKLQTNSLMHFRCFLHLLRGIKRTVVICCYNCTEQIIYDVIDCSEIIRGDVPVIRWEILRLCKEYKTGTRKCDVCLTEKLMILKEKGPNSLNKRSELMYTCPYRQTFRLSNLSHSPL